MSAIPEHERQAAAERAEAHRAELRRRFNEAGREADRRIREERRRQREAQR